MRAFAATASRKRSLHLRTERKLLEQIGRETDIDTRIAIVEDLVHVGSRGSLSTLSTLTQDQEEAGPRRLGSRGRYTAA
jgi:hypothetical protein